MTATSLDLSQIRTDALSAASTFRSLIGLGTLATQSPTGTADSTTYLRGDFTWQTISGGGTWGSITGTLSSQTDLQNALNAKASLSGATFTGAVTITQGTANTSVLTSTGYSLTGSNAQSLIDLAGTWNTTGTPTAIKLNVTDTASNASSLLLDLQVGGSSKVRVEKSGNLTVNAPKITLNGSISLQNNSGGLEVYRNSGQIFYADSSNCYVGGAFRIGFNNGLVLEQDAAGTLAQRNGTSAQTYRLYNTYTDASNHDRLALSFATYSSVLYARLLAESAGTGAANINLVLTPKGTGAILAQVPDGTYLAGNPRGQYAVDFQMTRDTTTAVASGASSTISGGSGSRAAGMYSTVAGGRSNDSSNQYAVVAGGRSNAASGDTSSILGGWSNIASGDYSVVGGGFSNTASGIWATVSGGRGALANRPYQQAFAACEFSTRGDAQDTKFILKRKTTDATATSLLFDDTTRLTIPSGKIFAFVAKISGIKSDGSAVAFYTRKGAIKNVGGTTTLVGNIETLGTDTEDNVNTDVAITADDTNDALQINVTGIASETWRWVAVVEGVEIGYGT